MARKRRVVSIPKPPKSAFNKNRPAGTLLRAQAVHLRHALARYVQKVARHLNKVGALLATDLDAVKTEGDVSEYAKRVTAILHPHGGKRESK
jgi:uncharacterized protein (DUF1330 family)